MPVYTPDQYQKVWRARAIAIRKAKRKTDFAVAVHMERMAKSFAPVYTGATRRGIRKYKTKTGYRVESTVPTAFKQNMWANQSAPFRTNKKMGIYGQRSYRWTGKPRFFHYAALETQKYFMKLARINTRKALRVSV